MMSIMQELIENNCLLFDLRSIAEVHIVVHRFMQTRIRVRS